MARSQNETEIMFDESSFFNSPNVNPIPHPLTNISNSNSNDVCLIEGEIPSFNLESHQLSFDVDLHDIIEAPPPQEQLPIVATAASWDSGYPCNNHQLHQQAPPQEPVLPVYLPSGMVPELLNLLELPQCRVGSAALNSFDGGGSMVYDEPMHLRGYTAASASRVGVRELLGSLPVANYGIFCGFGEREGDGEGEFHNGGLLEYEKGDVVVKGTAVKGNFATERQRRVQLNEKFDALRSLIPTPTKVDRASVVSDAIDYIKELLRTVDELKLLVEKKRRARERSKLRKEKEDQIAGDMESSSMGRLIKEENDETRAAVNGHLRCSWLQRRSKETFVDVRIIDDEVNVKLTQKKKANALLFAAKAMEELQLDLLHVAGGNIGDYHIFFFNSKICEGSSVYAGAVASKLLEAMARQHTTTRFSNGY